MGDLSERQTQILKAITDEYIESGEPVGSSNLVEKYNLNCSPATVRNEMAHLSDQGFLQKPHTSAGRIPTPLGLRYYISNLMKEKEVPVLQEVAIKQRLWQERFQFEQLLRQAALAMADVTANLGLALSSEGYLAHAGAVKVLDYPEFYDIEVTRTVLNLLDHCDLLQELFAKAISDADVHILLGEETELENFAPCGVVFSRFDSGKHSGTISVLGPSRMKFDEVVPVVRYFGKLLGEVGREW
jgi:transcriptional regulator of heat shock response